MSEGIESAEVIPFLLKKEIADWKVPYQKAKDLKINAANFRQQNRENQALAAINDAAIAEEEAFELAIEPKDTATRILLGSDAARDYLSCREYAQAYLMSQQVLKLVTPEYNKDIYDIMTFIQKISSKKIEDKSKQNKPLAA